MECDKLKEKVVLPYYHITINAWGDRDDLLTIFYCINTYNLVNGFSRCIENAGIQSLPHWAGDYHVVSDNIVEDDGI